jgi:hypothetical protein
MEDALLIESLRRAGALEAAPEPEGRKITAADLYEDGFYGRKDSHERRGKLLGRLGFPARLSAKGLLAAMNAIYTYDEYKALAAGL